MKIWEWLFKWNSINGIQPDILQDLPTGRQYKVEENNKNILQN